MFFEMFPNLSSLVIVNMTLTLAGNIGLETGLTFLGFGLPAGTPSLGTLDFVRKESRYRARISGGYGYLQHY